MSNSMKLSHAVWGHPRQAGHGGEVPKKKKCKMAKWLSEEGLQITEEEEKLKAKEKRKDRPI